MGVSKREGSLGREMGRCETNRESLKVISRWRSKKDSKREKRKGDVERKNKKRQGK